MKLDRQTTLSGWPVLPRPAEPTFFEGLAARSTDDLIRMGHARASADSRMLGRGCAELSDLAAASPDRPYSARSGLSSSRVTSRRIWLRCEAAVRLLGAA